MFKLSQRGVSLFLTIIMLSIILTIVFGLSAILISQIRTIQKMGYSVVSFYVADTETEKALEPVLEYIKTEVGGGDGSFPVGFDFEGNIDIDGNTAEYVITIYCCDNADTGCWFKQDGKECPNPLVEDPEDECEATFFCIETFGEYSGTKRAIKTRIFPVPIP